MGRMPGWPAVLTAGVSAVVAGAVLAAGAGAAARPAPPAPNARSAAPANGRTWAGPGSRPGAADRVGSAVWAADRAAAVPPAERLYAPGAPPGAVRQAAELGRAGRRAEAAGVLAMARTPRAVWFGGRGPDGTERGVRTLVREAARAGSVPVLVLYDVPGRDCAQYSSGGATGSAAYRAWLDAVARGLGGGRALVVLEPDSLALLPADCGRDDRRGTRTAARYTDLRYAVAALAPLAGVRLYLDGGNPSWRGVRTTAARLVRAGVTRTAGFFVNVANYQTDAANAWYGKLVAACVDHTAHGGAVADCPDLGTPHARARAWLAARVHTPPSALPHFVTDTGRNGRGPWTAPRGRFRSAEVWCNPPDRGLGARPTRRTGDPLQDARLWIKIPGESDGACLRGTRGPDDPGRGRPDPAAGAWFPDMALELVRGARPPVLPGSRDPSAGGTADAGRGPRR
ncbi:glucanase [Streptomyces sulfonofaciens]|uniref:Glucanase n=1 Tax=Streptomyces sulfonofaciens TaxID=68272 RepID=A0A919G7K5_9ACTN|nr:glycoside hydrolase family 6 protein [Streptomyces sulfonofaciens]GHH79490.1 glucanase [Streptomyces sulfonofaciens]